ncbi:MAG TPA: sigma 54-interacting transcriptional regulator [Ktedonobacteraceae bacterium]|nr:sigma 54-interacting transcriptional regulator [Ktedonobacteraceae bacterium]
MQVPVRDYWSVWKQFVLHGVMQDEALPPALIQSWKRCAAHGLDPYGDVNSEETTQSVSSSISRQLLSLVRPVMEDLHQFIEGSSCVVVFADDEARIVDCFGDQDIQVELEHLGLKTGASWHEDRQGSNALALALQESFPLQLEGAMHYLAVLHPLYTSAAPVHDLLGSVVGILGVVGRHDNSHPHTLGMITAAAQAVSNQLQMQVWLSNANDLLSELKTILQTLPEGVLLLRRDGVISQMNGPAGTMLGLSPTKVAGRRLSDVLPLPSALAQAINRQQQLSDEELVFDTSHGRVTCLCSLKAISSFRLETGLEDIVGSTGLVIAEPVVADGFVMILRSIERVQKLVNRMTGARARLTFANVVGESSALKEAMRLARLAATSNSTVLLHGETGTGKEIFAQSIHNSSARADGPFVAVNCAAIPRELINTELFGYEGGSFTGADRQGRSGKFEQAHGGTLFLDEIGDMPLDLQTALLRAIETHTVVRIGGQRVIPVDVRIIAATHKDLREEARRGNFRADLFYRLNVLTISIPPLRDRVDDLPLLVQHFLQRQSRVVGRALTIGPDAMVAIQSYSWPGNIRELENTLERVTYLMPKSTIGVEDLPFELQQSAERAETINLSLSSSKYPSPAESRRQTSLPFTNGMNKSAALKEQSSQAEMQAIIQALQASAGQVTRAAALLGISRTTLWRKMVKYNLDPAHDAPLHL